MIAGIALVVALQGPKLETFQVNGVARQANVVLPADLSKPAPLVFGFHGHGGNMRNAQRSFGIERYWPEAIVVYPQGLPSKGKTDPKGEKNGWQQNAADYDGRDIAFFDTMLKAIEKEYKVDVNRVYSMGHSNGGRFTYLLWAERGDTFAAVAPSASPAIGLARKLKPLSAFIVAGEKDQLVSFQSQKLSIDWVERLLEADSSKAKVDGYLSVEPAPNGLELATYVFPGPHTFPPEVSAKVVEFFKRHHR